MNSEQISKQNILHLSPVDDIIPVVSWKHENEAKFLFSFVWKHSKKTKNDFCLGKSCHHLKKKWIHAITSKNNYAVTSIMKSPQITKYETWIPVITSKHKKNRFAILKSDVADFKNNPRSCDCYLCEWIWFTSWLLSEVLGCFGIYKKGLIHLSSPVRITQRQVGMVSQFVKKTIAWP